MQKKTNEDRPKLIDRYGAPNDRGLLKILDAQTFHQRRCQNLRPRGAMKNFRGARRHGFWMSHSAVFCSVH